MGERGVRNAEVAGSIPVPSTKSREARFVRRSYTADTENVGGPDKARSGTTTSREARFVRRSCTVDTENVGGPAIHLLAK